MKWLYGFLIFYTIYELITGYWASSVLLWSITFIIQGIIIIIKKNKKKQKQKNNQSTQNQKSIYHKKEFITNCEKEFLIKLNKIFKRKYTIQPQIPLRMIISKNGEDYGVYAGELNRYIDFGIFDKNYMLLALIELNDKSHNLVERQDRDLKVQSICKQANIPLITFWTYEKLTNEEIKHRIEKEINDAR